MWRDDDRPPWLRSRRARAAQGRAGEAPSDGGLQGELVISSVAWALRKPWQVCAPSTSATSTTPLSTTTSSTYPHTSSRSRPPASPLTAAYLDALAFVPPHHRGLLLAPALAVAETDLVAPEFTVGTLARTPTGTPVSASISITGTVSISNIKTTRCTSRGTSGEWQPSGSSAIHAAIWTDGQRARAPRRQRRPEAALP
jgi:hypothetical protein